MCVWIDENYLVTYINNQKGQVCSSEFNSVYVLFLFVFGGDGGEKT